MAELAVEGRRLLCLADVVIELALKDRRARQRKGDLHRALCPRVRLRDERDMARHARAAHRRRGGEVHIVGAVLDFSQLVKVPVERTPRINRDILFYGACLRLPFGRILYGLGLFAGTYGIFCRCRISRRNNGRDSWRGLCAALCCCLCARHAIRCQGQCQPQQDGGHLLLAARGTHRAIHEMEFLELHQNVPPLSRMPQAPANCCVLCFGLDITLFSEIQEKSFSKEGFLLS